MPGAMTTSAALAAAGLACGWLAASAANAGTVQIEAGSLEFGGLEIEGLDTSWNAVDGAGGALRLRAARVRGLAATGPLADELAITVTIDGSDAATYDPGTGCAPVA